MAASLALVDFFHDLPKPGVSDIIRLMGVERTKKPKKVREVRTPQPKATGSRPDLRRLVGIVTLGRPGSLTLNRLGKEELGVDRLDRFLNRVSWEDSPPSTAHSSVQLRTETLLEGIVIPPSVVTLPIEYPQDAYVYTPLRPRQIRLLSIAQKTPYLSRAVSVRLIEVSLDDAPQYEALSYRWYSKIAGSPITCDGKKLLVPANCRRALKRFQSRSSFLWVDAICINQSDKVEKGEQVVLMSEIYRKAQRTVVWLGEDKDLGASCLADIEAASPYLSRNKLRPLENMASKKNPILKLISDKTSAPSRMLTLLLTRAWFARIWILQEVALATKIVVICGGQQASWKAIARFLKAMDRDSRLPREWFHAWNLITFRKEYRQRKETGGVDIYSALIQARTCFATNRRDKVYALLGVCDELARAIGVPDYNLPVVEVWTQAFKACLESKMSINSLSLVTGAPVSLALPSWVPDLCQHRKNWICRPRPIDELDGTPRFKHCTSPLGDSLLVWCDVVDEVKIKFSFATEADSLLTTWRQWWAEYCRGHPISQTLQTDWISVFWAAALGDVYESFTTGPTLLTWHQQFLDGLYDNPPSELGAVLLNEIPDILGLSQSRRVLGQTTSNRLGLFEHEVAIGDKIILLSGATTPYVVRHIKVWRQDGGHYVLSSSSNYPYYKLIGPCFVSGLMSSNSKPASTEGYKEMILA